MPRASCLACLSSHDPRLTAFWFLFALRFFLSLLNEKVHVLCLFSTQHFKILPSGPECETVRTGQPRGSRGQGRIARGDIDPFQGSLRGTQPCSGMMKSPKQTAGQHFVNSTPHLVEHGVQPALSLELCCKRNISHLTLTPDPPQTSHLHPDMNCKEARITSWPETLITVIAEVITGCENLWL